MSGLRPSVAGCGDPSSMARQATWCQELPRVLLTAPWGRGPVPRLFPVPRCTCSPQPGSEPGHRAGQSRVMPLSHLPPCRCVSQAVSTARSLFIPLFISGLPITISHHFLFPAINFSFPISEGLTPTRLWCLGLPCGAQTCWLRAPRHRHPTLFPGGTQASWHPSILAGMKGSGELEGCWHRQRGESRGGEIARQKGQANGAYSFNRFNFCRGWLRGAEPSIRFRGRGI